MESLLNIHYSDVIMGMMVSQITSLTIVYSTVYSGADQRKHQSSASLAFVLGIHQWPVNSPQKWPVSRKMFPFDDVIMSLWSYVQIKHPQMTTIFTLVSTHLPLDKMAAILQTTFSLFKCIFMDEKFCILLQISWKFVPKGPMDNKSALVQVMAWRWTGDKPLPGPRLISFTITDEYIRHSRKMGVNSLRPREAYMQQ